MTPNSEITTLILMMTSTEADDISKVARLIDHNHPAVIGFPMRLIQVLNCVLINSFQGKTTEDENIQQGKPLCSSGITQQNNSLILSQKHSKMIQVTTTKR